MKTIFGLFEDYQAAAQAVDSLLEAGFEYEELNVLVTRNTAENWSHNNGPVQEADSADSASVLDEMIDRRQGLVIPETGAAYAAGPLANLIARTAIDSSGGGTGLEEALAAFNLNSSTARTYHTGLHAGGLLVFIRTEDERAAEAATLLRERKAKEISIPN